MSTDNTQPTIFEDDNYIYIPEELFEHLPAAHRETAETRKKQSREMLQVAEDDLRRLAQLVNTSLATSSLSYIFHRLRAAGFQADAEGFMEQEMLTTAFVVTYARLFTSGKGRSGVSRDTLPEHLQSIHDDIMSLRNKRYAHSDDHTSVAATLTIAFDDERVHVQPQMLMGLHFGGRNEWAELIAFLDGLMHDRLQKILRRLNDKTGKEWTFPTGDAPDWANKSGS